MADLEGLEPPAPWFEAKCSIQLSYRSVPVRSWLADASRKMTTDSAVLRGEMRVGEFWPRGQYLASRAG